MPMKDSCRRICAAGTDAGGRQGCVMTGRNPWVVLGLPEDASYEEIQRAYRGKVKQTHPDRGGAAPDFRTVVEAVEDLRRLRSQRSVTTRQSQYDRWLRPHCQKGLRADHGHSPLQGSCGPSVGRQETITRFRGVDFGALLQREMAELRGN